MHPKKQQQQQQQQLELSKGYMDGLQLLCCVLVRKSDFFHSIRLIDCIASSSLLLLLLFSAHLFSQREKEKEKPRKSEEERSEEERKKELVGYFSEHPPKLFFGGGRHCRNLGADAVGDAEAGVARNVHGCDLRIHCSELRCRSAKTVTLLFQRIFQYFLYVVRLQTFRNKAQRATERSVSIFKYGTRSIYVVTICFTRDTHIFSW